MGAAISEDIKCNLHLINDNAKINERRSTTIEQFFGFRSNPFMGETVEYNKIFYKNSSLLFKTIALSISILISIFHKYRLVLKISDIYTLGALHAAEIHLKKLVLEEKIIHIQTLI